MRHAQLSVISHIGFCNYDYVICIRLSCDQVIHMLQQKNIWQKVNLL